MALGGGLTVLPSIASHFSVVNYSSENSEGVRLKATADGPQSLEPARRRAITLQNSNALGFHGLVQLSIFKPLASGDVFNTLAGAEA